MQFSLSALVSLFPFHKKEEEEEVHVKMLEFKVQHQAHLHTE